MEHLNIRCNSVHPGSVRTQLWERQAEEQARKRGVPLDRILAEITMTSPMGGFNDAEDVAATVAFLASPDARRMTGEEIIIDGGLVNCSTYHLIRRREELKGA